MRGWQMLLLAMRVYPSVARKLSVTALLQQQYELGQNCSTVQIHAVASLLSLIRFLAYVLARICQAVRFIWSTS